MDAATTEGVVVSGSCHGGIGIGRPLGRCSRLSFLFIVATNRPGVFNYTAEQMRRFQLFLTEN